MAYQARYAPIYAVPLRDSLSGRARFPTTFFSKSR